MGRFRPTHEPVPGKPGLILGQLAAAYKGGGGSRQLPGTTQPSKNGVKYDEYQGFSWVLEHIDRRLGAADQAGGGGH